MNNSHWYHLFLHDACGVIRSKINFFLGGKVCLVGASGGHVALLPPLGSGTAIVFFIHAQESKGCLFFFRNGVAFYEMESYFFLIYSLFYFEISHTRERSREPSHFSPFSLYPIPPNARKCYEIYCLTARATFTLS